jgi:SAM-dependent methyltransferase
LQLETACVLDVGCAAGLVSAELARQIGFVVGVDVDVEAIRYAVNAQAGDHAPHFLAASGTRLPFGDGTFDAVVCNHVYEHVDDPQLLMREIHRVLRPGGSCYLAAGHTLQLVEPHHRLPLLSWLPRPAADAYVRATGRGRRYEERFLPPWRLRSLATGFARAELVSAEMLRDPGRFGFPAIARLPRPLRALIAAFASPLARAAPTWIWLLRR